jgi:putative endonuclease
MNKQHNQELGKAGEDRAVAYLIDHDFTIIARNYRTKLGEIDILATKSNSLYCIEVKTRSSTAYGFPSEAISSQKLRRMYIIAEIAIQNLKFCGECKLALIQILGTEISYTEL